MGGACCSCAGDDDDDEVEVIDGKKVKDKKGKPLKYDPDFKGPIRGKSRRPKDIPCLIIFLVFIIVLLAIGIYAWVNGRPERIVFPTDSRGRLCGVDNTVRDKPNLLFFDLTQCLTVISFGELVMGDLSGVFTCPTVQVCVAECPTANGFGVRNNPVCVDEVDTSRFSNVEDVDITNPFNVTATSDNVLELLDLIRTEKCAPYYIVSTDIANRCIPTGVDLINQARDVFNFTSSEGLMNLTNATDDVNFEDLILNVNIQDIVDGNFTQQVLVATRQFLLDVYQDFVVVWPALLIGLGVAMALSFIYILLLRCIAGPIIGLGIFLAFLLVIAVTVFSYYQFYCFQDASNILQQVENITASSFSDVINTTTLLDISAVICAATDPVREFIDSQLPWFEYQEYTWLAIGILGTIVLLVLIILIIFLAKKICISIAIIKEASKAVGGVPTSTIYPLLTWTLLSVVLLYWGVVAVFLLTSSEANYAIIMNGTPADSDRNITQFGVVIIAEIGASCDPTVFNDTVLVPNPDDVYSIAINCQFDQFVTSNFLLGIQIYHLFGLFWLTNFILALGEITLAGAFASWYWAFKKPKDVPTFALIESFGRALLFHAGSVAFGSLVIALIQLLRALLAYTQKKLKGKTGKVVEALLCLFQCCLWCFEKVIRYINRQAYIEIAIYGYDFCTASCKAVKLLLRNILTTAVKDRIVAFLLFLGKLAITGIVGVLAYIGFGGFLDLGTQLWGRPLNYYLLPVILLVIAAFLIASGFMSVYHMAVDTVFICAMEDLERNNGHDKPYFMSPNLKKLLNVKNAKKRDHTDGDGSVETANL